MQGDLVLVSFDVPPRLEEAMVDCLLELKVDSGFDRFPVYVHEADESKLSLSEQVSGKKNLIRFQLYLSESRMDALLLELCREFAHSGIEYSVLPVIDKGSL